MIEGRVLTELKSGIGASALGSLVGSLVGALLLTIWIIASYSLRDSIPAETAPTPPVVVAAYIFLMALMGGAVLSAPVSFLFVLIMSPLSRRFPAMLHPLVWGALGALASIPIFLVLSGDPGLQFTVIDGLILGLAGAAGGCTSYRYIAARRIRSDP